MDLEMMKRLAAHPCDACKRGDHDACDNEEANAGATYAGDFILVCVCEECSP